MKAGIFAAVVFAVIIHAGEGQQTTLDVSQLLQAALRPHQYQRPPGQPATLTQAQGLANLTRALLEPKEGINAGNQAATEQNVRDLLKALLSQDQAAISAKLKELIPKAGANAQEALKQLPSTLAAILRNAPSAQFPTGAITDKETRAINLARDLLQAGSADKFQQNLQSTISPLLSATGTAVNTAVDAAKTATNQAVNTAQQVAQQTANTVQKAADSILKTFRIG